MKELNTDFLLIIICALQAGIERLTAENAALCEEKADLELMMEMSSEHADEIGTELKEKADASEQLFHKVLDMFPVPALIPVQETSRIYYVNQQACMAFGYLAEEFRKHKASDIYANTDDRREFLASLEKNGKISDFEVQLKKADGTLFWGALFSQTITFKEKPCLLTIVYDLSERKKAEEEIRRLNEELERAKEREGKYLMFILDNEEYGIDIMKIMEIIAIKPLTPIPGSPDYIKGVLSLRNSLIPVVDLRLRFNLNRLTILNVHVLLSQALPEGIPTTGFIVDSVNEVIIIKGKDIADAPEFFADKNIDFIFGMAKINTSVKIILDIEKLLKNTSAITG